MSSKALTVPTGARQITADVWQTIQAIAPVAVASRMYGMTEDQMAVVMVAGYELGLPLTAAVDVIYVPKNGKPVLRPKGALALMYRSGLLEQIDWTSDAKSATVTLKRRGDSKAHSMTLTIEEAKAAGWKSAAWDTTPANLLRWRLVGWLADLLFTDVLMGLTIADDSWMEVEITAEGDVIEHVPSPKPAPQPKPQAPPAVPAAPPSPEKSPEKTPEPESAKSAPAAPAEETKQELTIYSLLELGFTAEQITVANEGLIPGTVQECEAVLAKLEAQKAEEGK